MLVLTRTDNEAFVVGNDVIIRVLGVRGSQVRIGILAGDKSVMREELLTPDELAQVKEKAAA